MRSFSVAAFVALLSLCPIASAQPYPLRPITMVVPFAAGGSVDTVARILAEPMKKALGQTVLVDNTTGAAGTIGVGRVARAAPDGYLLSIGHWSTHVVNGAIYPLTYDLLKDFEPVAMLASNPMIIISKSTAPVAKPEELLTWLKSSKQSLMVGTAGVGSGTHMGGLYLQNTTGAKFEYVPYRGSGPALQDLLAG